MESFKPSFQSHEAATATWVQNAKQSQWKKPAYKKGGGKGSGRLPIALRGCAASTTDGKRLRLRPGTRRIMWKGLRPKKTIIAGNVPALLELERQRAHTFHGIHTNGLCHSC